MTKRVLAMLAAASLVASSTAAVAAAPAPAVQTPLTQPATETVAGDNQFFALSGLALIFGIGVFAGLIATIVFAVKSGDNGNNAPIRTSP